MSWFLQTFPHINCYLCQFQSILDTCLILIRDSVFSPDPFLLLYILPSPSFSKPYSGLRSSERDCLRDSDSFILTLVQDKHKIFIYIYYTYKLVSLFGCYFLFACLFGPIGLKLWLRNPVVPREWYWVGWLV